MYSYFQYLRNTGKFLLNSVCFSITLIFVRERKKTDKHLLMTNIYRQSFPGHRTRNPEEDLALALNPVSGKILHVVPTSNLKKLSFPLVNPVYNRIT